MEIKTLENLSAHTILNAFNLAFSDYLVKFQLTLPMLEDKIHSENIRLEYSVGMFDQENLVGFILHGYGNNGDGQWVYNAGTGVVPTHRGRGITQQLYDHITPYLSEFGIKNHILEVLYGNPFAQRIYEQVGFRIVRDLDCLRGKIETNSANINDDVEVKKIIDPDWNELKKFWSVDPSWQNSIDSIQRAAKKRITLGVFKNQKLLGYTTFNPENGRIAQLAVDPAYRRQGIGSLLLSTVSEQGPEEISMFNIDTTAEHLLAFLNKNGMASVAKQYEMTYVVD